MAIFISIPDGPLRQKLKRAHPSFLFGRALFHKGDKQRKIEDGDIITKSGPDDFLRPDLLFLGIQICADPVTTDDSPVETSMAAPVSYRIMYGALSLVAGRWPAYRLGDEFLRPERKLADQALTKE